MKETGAGPGEACRIRWIDIDTEHDKIAINFPTKRHNPRSIPVSSKLISRLSSLPKNSERVFGRLDAKLAIIRLCHLCRDLAYKLGDERFKKINFSILRHFKGIWEYYHTKDIKHIQRILGHKHSNTTDIYVQIVEGWDVKPDRWTSKVAHSAEEACELIEAGFEYVGNIHSAEIFKKPK
ncbi:MAG: site-specific integrase [Candidatus Bathyarchaeota archaeon]|nr:site-specific integrase [Candidatus Bathyarchaeota archaeon]